MLQQFLVELRKLPELTGINSFFRPAVPQIQVEVDREKALSLGGSLLVTADHGNCEQMRNPDGSPNTAHTTNLVHILYAGADADARSISPGILADVAPTLLHLLGVPQPAEMTGTNRLAMR